MTDFEIRTEDPKATDVIRLIQAHLAYAQAWSKPEDVYVLEAEELDSDGVEFFSARGQGRLLAIGALSPVGGGLVEIKSMHTAPEFRRRGLGRAMLDHLVGIAAERGEFSQIGVETGMGKAFAPARRLYRSMGFLPCPPFGVHHESDDSICMSLSIDD